MAKPGTSPDEAVAHGTLPRRRAKEQTTQRSPAPVADQVLEIQTNRTDIAQIMVTVQQQIEEMPSLRGLTQLLNFQRHQLAQRGVDLSMARMLELQGEIKELLLIYPKRSGEAQPYMVACLSERDAEQQQILDKLNLSRYQRV